MSAIYVFNINKEILSVGASRAARPGRQQGRFFRGPPDDGPRGALPLGLLGQLAEVDLLPGDRARAESEKVPPGDISLAPSWWLSQSSSARSMPLTPNSSG